ncbi:FAD-dependent monooxygenase [Spongiactinospora sp. TRM90649]|uniref:FAD-dependent monooxygenase n=1 Tax=Spongiactinospora sp. TRM90649 TaxID=3031114 RepID=UPI0023F7BD86|nr:FAD-dependent monooxygenase [Spongiactinospora sp. TRM90649]MDF5753595.1 FAD-dependent monooxygenase [Spongiactinospora sp. TRM90649]
MRIAVVGAGLGGVAAAVGLHRTGHEVTLFERAAELREAGTGIVVMPNGLHALDTLGLAEDVRGHVIRATRAGLRDRRGRPLLITDLNAAQSVFGTPVIIDRAELHRILRAPLPDALVRTATPIERLEPAPTSVRVIANDPPAATGVIADGTPGPTDMNVIANGTPIATVDAVIAADGIGSALRAQLFPDHPGPRRIGRMDLRGMLPRPAGLDPEPLAGQLVDRRNGAMFGLFPLGDDRLYWFTDTALHGPPPGPEEARRQMLSLMADWHPTVTAVIEATPPTAIYVDPIGALLDPLPSYVSGRVALLGDAAHAMSPDLGQGASQAFEDAAALTRHLTGATTTEVAQRLLRYDAERRPRAGTMVRAALRQSRLTSQTGPTAWLRDALLRTVPSRLAARQLAALWQV